MNSRSKTSTVGPGSLCLANIFFRCASFREIGHVVVFLSNTRSGFLFFSYYYYHFSFLLLTNTRTHALHWRVWGESENFFIWECSILRWRINLRHFNFFSSRHVKKRIHFEKRIFISESCDNVTEVCWYYISGMVNISMSMHIFFFFSLGLFWIMKFSIAKKFLVPSKEKI